MRLQVLTLFIFSSLITVAQNDGKKFFDQLTTEVLIFHEDGLAKGSKEVKTFLANFNKSNGAVSSYKQNFSIEVHPKLDYEIGEIRTESKKFPVMFLRNKDGSKSSIELLAIYEKSGAEGEISGINEARDKWMELCNAHKANELVNQIYTTNAYYYNRGRLLQGTNAISQEYGYMNSPSYSLKLTPKHVVFISQDVAYEIGRCSGSYPLPYMLLWIKQADGDWKVLMDSNY